MLESWYQEYDNGVKTGSITPATYPSITYGTALLVLFLLIPPTTIFSGRAARYLIFAIIYLVDAWIIDNCRAYGSAISFGVGIVTAWGTVWAATLLVFTNAKADYKRIEERLGKSTVQQGSEVLDEEIRDEAINSDLRKRNASANKVNQADEQDQSRSISYVWQSYPTWPFQHRLRWVLDLVGNFRGLAWNWRINGLPSLPPNIQAPLQTESDSPGDIKDVLLSKTGLRRYETYSSLILHNIWMISTSYFIMDILKVIAIHDPYFWGQVDSAAPSYLPLFIQNSGILTRYYRLFMTQCGVWIALRMIYSLSPLFFVGVLGPKYLGINGEPWMYPDQYGSYSKNVLDRGLAGWWGGWWHQMFRYAFESGGKWVTTCLRLDPDAQVTKIIQLFVAFALSGYIHASGSKTSIGPSNPWNPFLFFVLQPIGILIQTLWRAQLKKWGISSRIPWPISQLANFVYTHVWFYFTGPLLADDFAKAGVWLSEPIMLSPLRALGFGAEGDGLYCWGGRVASWHRSDNVMLSGIAL